jgi:hypothetical protein
VDDAKFVGSSAGSLVGLALGMETLSEPPTCPLGLVRAQLTALPTAALGLSFERIRDFQLGCVDRTHGSLVGAFSLKKYVDEIMDDMLPDDAYITIGDRVEVSLAECARSEAKGAPGMPCTRVTPWCIQEHISAFPRMFIHAQTYAQPHILTSPSCESFLANLIYILHFRCAFAAKARLALLLALLVALLVALLLKVVFDPRKSVDVERANTVDDIRGFLHNFLLHDLVLLVSPRLESPRLETDARSRRLLTEVLPGFQCCDCKYVVFFNILHQHTTTNTRKTGVNILVPRVQQPAHQQVSRQCAFAASSKASTYY